MNAKVYISNLSPLQKYESAKLYGALVPLTKGNVPIFKTTAIQEEIKAGLEDSTPDDFLIISGSAVIAALVMGIWLTLHPTCKLLLYDKREDSYSLRVIDRADYERRGETQTTATARLRQAV